VRVANVIIQSPPGGIELEEGVFDEMTCRHYETG
jgi:hypothetical protein